MGHRKFLMFRPRAALPTWLALALLGLAQAGCSFVDRRLNDPDVALENRSHNRTRAALAAPIRPLAAIDRARGQTPEIKPASRPSTFTGYAPTYPLLDARTDDGIFVGLAISGGGSRSANFAAACMLRLQELGLLQRVDYISCVSGGSLVAAYYCLSDAEEWNPGELQRKLTHSFATDLIIQTLLPWNASTLLFTDMDRTDLLARGFEEHLFSRHGKPLTFDDLRQDRPRLLINATNLQSGRSFVFSNESFDEINADLGNYPIGYAVAASAAVPVLLHHVTLRDYSTIFEQFVHLIDGGVTDNLGVQILAQTYVAHLEQAQRAGLKDPYPRGAVIFVIDATTKFDARLSSQSDFDFMTSLITGAGLSTTALLNRVSSATLADLIVRNAANDLTADKLREKLNDMERTGVLRMTGRDGRPVRVVHLALSRVGEISDLPFASFEESVNNIATYFNIEPTEAFHLYQAADLLFKEKFDTVLHDLKAEIENTDAPAPTTRPANSSLP